MFTQNVSIWNERLNFFLIYGWVIVGSLALTMIYFPTQATPFWQCDSVYGGGYYARSCFNMSMTFFLWINGMIMGFGYFFLRMNNDKIQNLFASTNKRMES